MKKVFSIYMSVFLLGVILTACGGGGGGSSPPTPPSPKTPWTIQHGTVSNDLANGIALDSNGNIYVTGYTLGGLDGNIGAGGRDIFVVKYAADGTRQWTKQLGTASDDEAMGIAVDTSGNVYVTGYTSGDLDGSNKGNKDFFVVKLTQDQQGVPTVAWTKQLGTTEDDWAIGIAVDGSYIYVTGWTAGNLGGSNQGGADLFVVKLTQDTGGQVWARQLGTTVNDFANGIALDSIGNIYVTGYTLGGLDGNTNANPTTDPLKFTTDIFVVKYDADGNKIWTQQRGTAADDVATGIALDSSGNIYVNGLTTGYLGDTGSKVGTDDADFFVAKLGPTGNPIWTKQLGTVDDDWANGIALDSSGNIYVTGFTYGGLDGNSNANPTTVPSDFTPDIIVVKYAADGTKKWTRQLGTVANDWAMGIALDSSGSNIYVTGGTCGNLDGNTNAGCSDFFVVKYAADGTKQ